MGEGVSGLLATNSGKIRIKGSRLYKVPATLDQKVNLLLAAGA